MGNGQAAKKTEFQECLSCLSGQVKHCKAVNLVDEALFVEAAHAFLCYNRTSFGDSYICRCPFRKEFYKRYGQ